jgi:glutamate-1-semialdehyde aminotransferase
MNWMVKWAGPHPVFVERAEGARFIDVDGNEYADFCLGDTGAMAGHSPAPTVEAVRRQVARGITTMLPTEDAIAAGEELQRRFGLRYWQFTITATDANRFALRLARMLTGRPMVVVHDHCYHGSVDESLAGSGQLGTNRPPPRETGGGPALTGVVEFNGVSARAPLARATSRRLHRRATGVGSSSRTGYHDAVRAITRRTGTILTSTRPTRSRGPGRDDGGVRSWAERRSAIGGGIPVGTYG